MLPQKKNLAVSSTGFYQSILDEGDIWIRRAIAVVMLQ